MSLNKSLDRFFDEIRREAKRNPDFANRLDAVMRAHGSRQDVPEAVVADVSSPANAGGNTTPALNPVAIYRGDGEAALVAALKSQGVPALQALVAEHNLDPSAETGEMDREALFTHIVAQAKRRAERDEKLFDY